MTRDQQTVAIGAASGVAGMALLVWSISTFWPEPHVLDTNSDRIAYALRWSVVAVLPLFCMIAAVGNARFASEAIDPTQGKEDHKTVVNGRVADNTTQQFLLYLIGITALSVSVPIELISLIPAIAITFFICRIVFWVGYRIHPLYRAPGFSSTAYMNGFMYIAVLWLRLAG
jgi:hypothetical protein